MALFFNYVDEQVVKNLPHELLNLIGKYRSRNNEYDDIRLYERKTLNWRTIIDNTFPSMLVVDFNDIRKELKNYNDTTGNHPLPLHE